MLIYGYHTVNGVVDRKENINKIWITKDLKNSFEIIKKAKELNVPVSVVDSNKLNSLLQKQNFKQKINHQGIIADVSPIKYCSYENILNIAKTLNEVPFIVLLDSIEDPVNIGSIIRTACAAGVHGIIIPKDRACQITDVVYKVAVGALNFINIARVTNLVETIKELKKQGLWIIGADANGEYLYYKTNLTGPIGLVIGSEGKGLRELVKKNCDFMVNIPMSDKISSLNAAVAGSILIYEIIRQRDVIKNSTPLIPL